jgi:hypothetical protein
MVACFDSPNTVACSRRGLADLQLGVACVGVAILAVLAHAAWTGRARRMRVTFALACAVWLAWAILNDAATHGWNNLRLVPW